MRIGIDMDGVIVDTAPALMEQANVACKINLTMEDMTEPSTASIAWEHLTDKRKRQMGVEGPKDLNSWLFPPEFFTDLPPMEGAIEVVKALAAKHEIAIVTKPVEWSCCTYEKDAWLEKHLGDTPYELIMVSSMEAKGWIGADVIVDDDIRVIRACTLSVPIVIKQPWNELYLKDLSARVVDSMVDVPAMLEEIQRTELFKDI